jgi:4-amino-4-deoxy-L-arabinose transferase-like glycosyltransferase
MSTTQIVPPLRGLPAAPAGASPNRRQPHVGVRRDPSWARPALLALLLFTALAYIWDLSASGNANAFYAAAVQAGTKSWKAFFFGSLDSANFITVDKPPASLWVMSLSGRIFGFSSWSMLVPQALEGVAAVGLLYASVKRWFGAGPGLAAGAIFALTPVAALMFRFNNPDALLVLMLVAGAYCVTRALETAGTRWVLAAGVMIGAAFLAKMMQAFLVLPAFAAVYTIAAPTTLPRRIWQLLAGAATLLVSAGWWVAVVALWPASSRPYIDGSSSNSILDLITGYNGLGRIFGSGGSAGGGAAGFGGASGPARLFNDVMGGQVSWLLPAAALALIAGLWARRREPRTDRMRAALLLWGGWLIVTALVFSLSRGVIHSYYTVALAPPIGALVAIGGVLLWSNRTKPAARVLAAVAVGGSAAWAYDLLDRTPTWQPWLRNVIAIAGALSVLGLLIAPSIACLRRRATFAAAVLGAIASMAGPIAYTIDTVTTAHTGSLPAAGPTRSGASGEGPGAGGGPPKGSGGRPSSVSARSARAFAFGRPAQGGGPATGGEGASTQVSSTLVRALRSDASHYRWAAATSGSQNAASLELASGEPVMAIGGFTNQGGNLPLATFEQYVAAGKIHYYIAADGGGGAPGRGGSADTIASWVKAHFTSKTVGQQTVYDLTASR